MRLKFLSDIWNDIEERIITQCAVLRRRLILQYCRSAPTFTLRHMLEAMGTEEAQKSLVYIGALQQHRPDYPFSDLARFQSQIMHVAENHSHRWLMEEALAQAIRLSNFSNEEITWLMNTLVQINASGHARIEEIKAIDYVLPGIYKEYFGCDFPDAGDPAKLTARTVTERITGILASMNNQAAVA